MPSGGARGIGSPVGFSVAGILVAPGLGAARRRPAVTAGTVPAHPWQHADPVTRGAGRRHGRAEPVGRHRARRAAPVCVPR
ncbi:hypothetical protein FRACA_1330011 [Frankia canadensis]|uniref:Uncharacterized protein n=1 Tax=Frankia canadensis TaxID=1836972 RepID=A0A2I2KKU1_9ACTN|nr:hypothetical protein FRACA_1330011 [Frankia canadensis]SOU53582.1 hypothetical protein FRACA_1330011 [Frankia canadensis]